MLRASIVIVEFNTLRHLPDCLESLRRMCVSHDEYEVLLVDNASPTPARPLLQRFPWIRLLETTENLGFAGGQNAALEHCRGEFIVSLNPDTQVAVDWLPNLLSAFSHSRVGVAGCKIYYPGTNVLQHAGGIILPCGRSEHRGRGEHDLGQYDELTDVPYVCGAALAVRRSVIEDIGFFSTAYFPAYYDDTELCTRARRAGYRVVYAPQARLWHQEWAASDVKAMQHFKMSETSRIRFIARNYSLAEVAARFLPEEIAFQLAPDRALAERAIALSAYFKGALSAWRERAGVEAREVS